MFFLSQKALSSRFLLAAMVPFLCIQNPINAKQQSTEIDPAAENWYQVEVILFDQKTINDTEAAPKDLYLSFPENWLELGNKYPDTGIMRRPIFDQSTSASILKPNKNDLTQRLFLILGAEQDQPLVFNHGSTSIPEASIPYQNQSYENPGELEPFPFDILDVDKRDAEEAKELQAVTNTKFKPVYEQPFQKLDKKHRDLNDTARALNRRNYNVRFHQAWRFQIKSKQQSPWILVKTIPEVANRQAIEGSLRFYKSRYLHFESDLWRIIFSNSENSDIVLPEIPQKSLNSDEKTLLKAIRFSNKLLALRDNLPSSTNLSADTSNQEFKGIEDALKAYNLNSVTPLLDSARDTTAETAKTGLSPNYSIKEIWPIKQSKRIQEDEVYYIDHPYMGTLVTIKAYKPEPINTPPQIALKDENSELSGAE